MAKSISKPFPINLSITKNYLVLFLLWPFLAFITALLNYSQKESKKVVYFFLIYYGLTFVLQNIGTDAEAYAGYLKLAAKLPFSDFFKIVGGLYTDTSVDMIEPLIRFIVSRFTSHHGILFAAYAAIFGFFYLKSIDLLHDYYQENPGWNARIMMFFFIMIMPITTVSGVRMPIATWIFFYGAYHVVLYRDPRYFILTVGSSLMHWSFFSANAILIVYFFAGNRNLIYLPVTILSFLLPQLMAPVIQSIANQLGGSIQARYQGYSNEEYILGNEESYEGASWFLSLSGNLAFYFLILAIVVIQLTSSKLMKNNSERNLFSFLLVFLAFVNFGKAVPTFGGRFQVVFYLFATLYVFLYFLKLPGNKINILIWIGLFPMLLHAAVMFRMGSESISAWLLAPGLGIPLLAPSLPLSSILYH